MKLKLIKITILYAESECYRDRALFVIKEPSSQGIFTYICLCKYVMFCKIYDMDTEGKDGPSMLNYLPVLP